MNLQAQEQYGMGIAVRDDPELREARNNTVWQTALNNALERPDKVGYVQVDDDQRRRELTYGEVVEQATRLSEGLYSIGVRRGDRVALWMTNRPEWIITYLATMRLGAVLVPLNTWLKAPEVAYMLQQSEARHLIIMDRFRGIDFFETIKQIVPSVATSPRGAVWSSQLPDLRNVVVCSRDGRRIHDPVHHWGDLALGDPAAATAVEAMGADVTGSDLALVKYTSGSTGSPKGVMIENGSVALYGVAHTERLGLTSDDVFFSAMPFFHSGGCMWGIQSMQAVGGRLVFTEAFDPSLAGALIESERATVMFGILANELVATAQRESRDFSSVRISRSGGKETSDLMPALEQIINPYGQTEAIGAATLCGPEDPREKQLETNGRPLRGITIKVVDPQTGRELGPREVGEAWIRGNVMRGYWKNPDATSKVIDDDGWIHSEDLVSIDEDGYVTFAGRLKLMLKVGGENVSVEEVERVILDHEAVFHCVVVGVPDPRKQETGRAYVVLRDGHELEATQLLEWLDSRLARFKIPRDVVVVDALPTLANAKFDRVAIQKMALSDDADGGVVRHE